MLTISVVGYIPNYEQLDIFPPNMQDGLVRVLLGQDDMHANIVTSFCL